MKKIELEPSHVNEELARIDPIIPTSEKRQQIDNLISAESIYGKDANPFYDQVGKLEGIEIIERRDYQRDDRYRCAWFAFKDDGWWTGESDLGLDFWDYAEKFLEGKGYTKVEQPQDGDIVMYRLAKDTKSPSTVKHVGLFQGGKVMSKFNQGHIFRHDIDMVPNMFGKSVVFMRKK